MDGRVATCFTTNSNSVGSEVGRSQVKLSTFKADTNNTWIAPKSAHAAASSTHTIPANKKRFATFVLLSATHFKLTISWANVCMSVCLNQAKKSSYHKGYFEDLEYYVGLAFNRDNKADVEVICSETSPSLLYWSMDCKKVISRSLVKLEDAKLNAAAFLWELVFDLCIDPRDNISESPGFETYLKQYGGPLYD